MDGFGQTGHDTLQTGTRAGLEFVDFFSDWAANKYPKVYWLAAFTFPTGFITAVLQTTARADGVAIDTLSWEFGVVNQDERSITQAPKDGVYVKGLYLEGAGWDPERRHQQNTSNLLARATLTKTGT